MTRDARYISEEEQKRWWAARETRRELLFLLFVAELPIGYGRIAWDAEDKPWVSGGVLAGARGRGYGRAVFEELARLAPSTGLWLDVLEDNERAYRLYRKLGWRPVSRANGRIVMELNTNSPR